MNQKVFACLQCIFTSVLYLALLGGQTPITCAVEPHSLHVSPAQGQRDLTAYLKTYSNLPQWQNRADGVRRGILQGAELEPFPADSPLRPICGARREHQGYTVENVAFESVPGFFVTGNLYRPLGKKGRHPGILCPMDISGVKTEADDSGPIIKFAVRRWRAWGPSFLPMTWLAGVRAPK